MYSILKILASYYGIGKEVSSGVTENKDGPEGQGKHAYTSGFLCL